MFICMGGYPYAGKSTFVKSFSKKIEILNPEIIDPKSYLEDIKNPSKEMNICAWKSSIEYIYERLGVKKNKHIIVLDTAAANFEFIGPIFDRAHKHDHDCVYIFIKCNKDTCQSRSEKIISERIWKSYKNIHITVQGLKLKSDLFVIVNNNDGTIKDLSKEAIRIVKKLLKKLTNR